MARGRKYLGVETRLEVQPRGPGRRPFGEAREAPVQHPVGQQRPQHPGEGQRNPGVGLHQQVEVQRPAGGGQVGQAVQPAPAPAAQAPDHRVGGSDRQRGQQQETGHPHHDERPPGQIGGDRPGLEALGEPHVGEQMQDAVEEPEQPEHAPEVGQPGPAGQLARRGHRQRQDQEQEGQDPGGAGGEFPGIGAQLVPERVDGQQEERHQTVHQDQQFGKACVAHRGGPFRSWLSDPFPRRGSPPGPRSR